MLALNDMISRSYTQRYIAQLRQYRGQAHNEFTHALNKIQEMLTPKDTPINEPKVRYIKRNDVPVVFDKTELRTPEDVGSYVDAMREALLKQLEENKRISL